jgi:hypothetical protein
MHKSNRDRVKSAWLMVVSLTQWVAALVLQVASLLDKYGEYIQEENDNNTKIIREALQTHAQVSLLSDPCAESRKIQRLVAAFPATTLPCPRVPLNSSSPCLNKRLHVFLAVCVRWWTCCCRTGRTRR